MRVLGVPAPVRGNDRATVTAPTAFRAGIPFVNDLGVEVGAGGLALVWSEFGVTVNESVALGVGTGLSPIARVPVTASSSVTYPAAETVTFVVPSGTVTPDAVDTRVVTETPPPAGPATAYTDRKST